MSEELNVGTRVRFTVNGIGTRATGSNVFTPHILGEGDTGEVVTYLGQLPGGWVMVRPDAYPDELAPVDPSMIEVAE